MSRRDSREATVKIIFQNEFIDPRLRTDGFAGEQTSVEDMLAMFVSSAEEKELELYYQGVSRKDQYSGYSDYYREEHASRAGIYI